MSSCVMVRTAHAGEILDVGHGMAGAPLAVGVGVEVGAGTGVSNT